MSYHKFNQVMKFFVVFLASMFSLALATGIVSGENESFDFPPHFENLTASEAETKLLEQGFQIEEYPFIPYGYKHYFSYHDSFHIWSDTGMSSCLFSATYPLREGESVNVVLKFPTDLIWAGSHDTSGFFIGRGGTHSYTDSSGNLVSTNTEVKWEKLQPTKDSGFVTLEYSLQDELSHLLVTKDGLPEWPTPAHLSEKCPRLPSIMEYDYYDGVNSIQRQQEYIKAMGFAPDVYICENNLVGAIKATNGKSVCVKPPTKEKLIERGWATNFTNYEK